MKISITRIFTFDSAHYLPNHEGKCQNLHGHTYKLEVSVAGPVQTSGPETGMVLDFGTLDSIVKRNVLNILDHTDLNGIFENPTAEEMVSWLWEELNVPYTGTGAELEKIRLWETPNSYAEVGK